MLMTLQEWITEAQTLASENGLAAEGYIAAGSPEIPWMNAEEMARRNQTPL
jgi:hypothetical protein